MKPAARLSAAIEILDIWLAGDKPVDAVLSEWGRAHRFAGSGDRSAIADRVYTALRRRSRLVAQMGAENGRALILASLADEDGMSADEIGQFLKEGGPHAPLPLDVDEHLNLSCRLSDLPPWVTGSYPQWLHPSLMRAFGDGLAHEAAAWLHRAPLDLRVNTLKASRPEAVERLEGEGYAPLETPLSPYGLRLPAGASISKSQAFVEGWIEIQDEGSQLAAAYAAVEPGMIVCELGAGAGGKSLALAAAMYNRGTIFAADIDAKRLENIAPRAARAGVSIIKTRLISGESALKDLEGICDLVLIDAPCSGSGTWRRDPDNKWRLTPQILAERLAVQRALLQQGAKLLKPGGHLVYVTCSVLCEENEDQLASFLERNEGFSRSHSSIRLSPASSGTDGFFAGRLINARG